MHNAEKQAVYIISVSSYATANRAALAIVIAIFTCIFKFTWQEYVFGKQI